jgi:hypothetical protein
MNKLICQKCNGEISNEFGVTLSYCTNCGASINLLPLNNETLSLKNKSQPNSRLFLKIILTSLFTVAFLMAIFLIGLRYVRQAKTNSVKRTPTEKSSVSPPPRQKSSSPVSASEITKVVFTSWRHEGPVSSPGGRVVSNSIEFLSDGTAFKTENAINYDDGRKQPPTLSQGVISKEQFEKLAKITVDNDFLSELDSTETISESQHSLTITYTTGEKKIILSNGGKDTPEVENIMVAIMNMSVDWKIK